MKTVLVTGGSGFVGRHLTDELEKQGYDVQWVNSENYDLREYSQVLAMLDDIKPDIVFDLAAKVGGIGANRRNPAAFWYENMCMGMNLLEASIRCNKRPEKIVMTGTTCSYPAVPPRIPFVEDDLFTGYPEKTNAPYGIAKRALLTGARAYREQHKLNVVMAIPTNLYGPGDNFSPHSSHVIPAIMRKIRLAGPELNDHARNTGEWDDVMIWGSGKATRDFLYVKDLVRGLILMAEKYNYPEPVNFGGGREVSIRQLAFMIGETADFSGVFRFDASKPDGQSRRLLDIHRAEKCLGWRPEIELAEGIIETWEWFVQHPLAKLEVKR